LSFTTMTSFLPWRSRPSNVSTSQRRGCALPARSVSSLPNLFATGKHSLYNRSSEFCGHPVCKICIVKSRPFPGQQTQKELSQELALNS
jgi:hypothetical protein